MSAAYRYNWFGKRWMRISLSQIMNLPSVHLDYIWNPDGSKLPFISFELLDQQGQVYNFTQTVNDDGTENIQGVDRLGLPSFSTAFIIGLSGILLAVSSSISNGLLFHWKEISTVFKQTGDSVLEDPNRTICKSYPDVRS